MVASDHRPIIATIDDKVIKFRKSFRFDKRWVGEEGLMDSITRGWNSRRVGDRSGIVDRIHWCRHEISAWRKQNPPYGKEKNRFSPTGS